MMYVKELGRKEAPTVVFLHGGGVSGWMWQRQADYFKDYRLLIPDLPGHGNSREEPFTTMQETAAALIEILEEKAEGQKVHLIGFSLGAQLGVEILSQAPQLLQSAILLSPLVRPFGTGKGMMDAAIKMCYGLMKNRQFQKLQAKVLYIGEEYFEQYFEDVKNTSLEDLRSYMNANMSYKLPETFKDHQVRTLVLAGCKEKSVMRQSAADLVHSNRYCIGYEIPGVGHGVSLADPELFNRLVKAWLEEKALPEKLITIK